MEKISRRDSFRVISALGLVVTGCVSQKKPPQNQDTAPIVTTNQITPEKANQAEEIRLVLSDTTALYSNKLRELGDLMGLVPESTQLSDSSIADTYRLLDPDDKSGYEFTIVSNTSQIPLQFILRRSEAVDVKNPDLRKYQEFIISCSDQQIGFSIQEGGFIDDQMIPLSLSSIQIDSGEAFYSVVQYPKSESNEASENPIAIAGQTQDRIGLDEVFRYEKLFSTITNQIDVSFERIQN